MAQPDAGAQIEDVRRRDPGLGQPAGHQQLAQVTGIGAVVLGMLLVTAQRGGVRGLGQMHNGSDPVQLLDHEPPARGRLQRDLQLLAGKSRQEPAHARPVGRRHARSGHFAGGGVQPIASDLRAMLIESHYDRQLGASSCSMVAKPARSTAALELRGSLHHAPDRPASKEAIRTGIAHAIYVKSNCCASVRSAIRRGWMPRAMWRMRQRRISLVLLPSAVRRAT